MRREERTEPRLWPLLVFIAVVLAMLGWCGHIRWTHPDMTDMRTLRTFWRSYVVMLVVLAMVGLLVAWIEHRDADDIRRNKAMKAQGQWRSNWRNEE